MSSGDGDIYVGFRSRADATIASTFADIARANASLAAELEKTTGVSARVDAGLKRFAERIKQISATPIQTLEREMERLDASVKAKLITQEEYGQAVAYVQRRYQEELKRTADAEKAAADAAAKKAQPQIDPELQRFGDQVTERNLTLQERYERQMTRVKAAVEAKALTVEAAAREELRLNQELERELAKIRDAKAAADAKAQPQIDPELQRFGDQVTERNLTLQERYERQMARVKAAVEAKALTVEAAAREELRLNEELQRDLDKIADKTSEADRELQKFAEQVKDVDTTPLERLETRMARLAQAEERGYLTGEKLAAARKRAQDEYQAELDDTARKVKRLEDEQRRAAEEGKLSFANMATYAKMAWAATAVYVTGVIRDMNAEAQKAGEDLKQSAPSSGNLAQLATKDMPLDMLLDRAKGVRAMGAADNITAANQFTFSVTSAGGLDELESLAKLKSLGILERPEALVESAAGLRTTFGVETAGTFRDLLNQAIVAAADSPANAESILKGAGKAGVAAKQQGTSLDELLAAVSIVSSATGSADEAGTKASAFFRGVSQYEPERDKAGRLKSNSPIEESLLGKSITDIVKREDLAQLSPAKLQKVLGSAESVQFYGVLRENIDRLEKLQAAVTDARENDLLGFREASVERQPELAAAARARRAEGEAEIARLRLGTDNLNATAAQQTLATSALRNDQGLPRLATAITPGFDPLRMLRGAGDVNSTLFNQGSNLVRGVGGDAFFLQLVSALTGVSAKQERAAEAQLEAAGILSDAARQMGSQRGRSNDWTRNSAQAQARRAGE